MSTVDASFAKRTRRGKVVKVVREHYLRDDIHCGIEGCELCGPPLAPPAALAAGNPAPMSRAPHGGAYIVIDTNVALHQMDLLETSIPPLCDMVVPQTVMAEVAHRNLALAGRLGALLRDPARRAHLFANEHHAEAYAPPVPGETPNDRNDRAIRRVAAWYGAHVAAAGAGALLLTDDAASAATAAREGLRVTSSREFVAGIAAEYPDAAERLAAAGDGGGGGAGADDGGDAGDGETIAAGAVYPEHWTMARISEGIKAGTLFQGTLRVNRDVWFEGRVGVAGGGLADVVPLLVRGGAAVNRATDGDVVAVQVLPRARWQRPARQLAPTAADAPEEAEARGGECVPPSTPARVGRSSTLPHPWVRVPCAGGGEDEGAMSVSELARALAAADAGGGALPSARVVGVIRRNWRHYAGSLDAEEGLAARGARAWFVPADAKLPRVRIATRQKEALMDKRIVVAIDAWPASSRWPLGHYVRTLGVIGDKKVETDVLLIEHDIPVREFSAAVMACLPPADFSITDEMRVGRWDLRDRCVISIDPPGCKDIDDALHVRELPDGTLEVGVHIADVSHFVKAGSAIDLEAADRGNTTCAARGGASSCVRFT